MDSSLYMDFFKMESFDDFVDIFHDTLIDTNRGYQFFVDWQKVKQNVEKYRVELHILNSLIRCPDFDSTLCYLVTNYPEVLPIIPLLLAVRDLQIKVVKDFMDADSATVTYDFRIRMLSQKE